MENSIKNINPLVKLLKQSSHYLTGNFVALISGFISMPILTRVLSTAEYGALSLIYATIWIALALAKGGLQEAAVRFYNDYKNGAGKDPSVFYSTLLFGSLGLAVLTGLALWGLGVIFGDFLPGPDSRNTVPLIAGLVVSGALFLRLNNFLRAEQNTKLYNLFVVLQRYAILAFGLFFMYKLTRPLKGFLIGSLLGESLIVLTLFFLLVRQGKIKMGSVSFAFLKDCLYFGFPLVGFELANFLVKIADRYLVQIFLGAESVGIYALAYNLCSYINDALFFAVWYAVYPIYIELWQKKGEAETAQFLSKASTYVLLIGIPLVWGFSALSEELIRLLASEKYAVAAQFIPYLSVGMIFWGFIPVLGAGIYIHKKTKALSAITFWALLLNVSLDLILIPTLKLHGAALGTLATYTFLIVAVMRKSAQYLKIPINGKVLVKSLVASALMYVMLINLREWTGFVALFAKILLGAAVYGLTVMAMDRQLRQTTGNVLTKRVLLGSAS